MLQRNRLRSVILLAAVASLLFLPVLAQAAPLGDDGPRVRAMERDAGWAGWWKAVRGVGEKEGPSIDPNGGGGGKRAQALNPGGTAGWWLWHALADIWGGNGVSIDPSGGDSNRPSMGGQGSTMRVSSPGSSRSPAVQ